MRLHELLARIALDPQNYPDIEVAGLTTDSRQVQPGDLFIGLPGTRVDGSYFWAQAVTAGAVGLVLSESARGVDEALVPVIRVADVIKTCAQLAAAFYDFPASKLTLVGVTGTNGKTTTTHLIEHLLSWQAKTGLVGTLYGRWPGQKVEARHTTPFALEIQHLLAQMVAADCRYAVMEVSSHALAQQRVAGCKFAAAVFTNLTQDHLDFHPDMESYFQAKAALFSREYRTGRAILNIDDPWGARLAALNQNVWTYSLKPGADLYPLDVVFTPEGIRGTLVTPIGRAPFVSPLVGQFNLANLLAAVGAVLSLGLDLEAVAADLAHFGGVPGRMERVSGSGDEITVIVDYAHTPDGLRKLLEATRPFVRGRLICIFGCGGDRDRTKRPQMGRIAAELSDWPVVTSDNPRTENPEAIVHDILAGIPVGVSPTVEVDRRRAIHRILQQARSGDCVVIAGKGHEDYQILGTTKIHFDDREEARAALAERHQQ
ncbi:UDP-N-acetylmuramoyl-L-alanyl-D-glutamate--2,6-diaminopimelate ligase [Gloeobacter kilaueensis]|uniref:UDP-N-acetylmuramoyl-L-alanyl-D-glutamate--2,6-diaminopimelate ligase n=1 Tax=Gloeobacter kilaueensis (strain ATCC BAA-2537 / CCAP 1431/1 / ULC 316 / JS1) TaxID=1183438 RepID=U5QJ61_GLOK1|nr:UDP-N-acetylmuramoyl-L-alanyl-D-glutamate--2,6-diaminopimelate ligase [Gloeobacter kilaueensis]AGY57664.1 UDP-N-acetylmuramoylalanyl-D-glutamate--2,6-diaminopimelate ligase [Gloeobacter kilaueensis JS1]